MKLMTQTNAARIVTNTATAAFTNASSQAGLLVLQAAERVRFDPPREVLVALEREAISEVWQLEYLDSYQWEALGAPMGLVTSIRRSLAEHKISKQQQQPKRQQHSRRSRLSPTRGSTLQRTSAKVMTAEELLGIPSQVFTEQAERAMSIISLDDGHQQQPQHQPMAISPASSSSQSRARSKSPMPPPLSLQPQESVDTYFPPTMPTRKQSRCCVESCLDDSMELSDDHWTCGAMESTSSKKDNTNVSAPPALPTRLSSTRNEIPLQGFSLPHEEDDDACSC